MISCSDWNNLGRLNKSNYRKRFEILLGIILMSPMLNGRYHISHFQERQIIIKLLRYQSYLGLLRFVLILRHPLAYIRGDRNRSLVWVGLNLILKSLSDSVFFEVCILLKLLIVHRTWSPILLTISIDYILCKFPPK